MIKKINIFLVLLLLFISIGAVSAVDSGNATDLGSNEAILDTLDVSLNENIGYGVEDVASDNLTSSSYTITKDNYNQYFSSANGKLVSSQVEEGDTILLDGSFSDKTFVFEKRVNIVGTSTNKLENSMITLLSGASGSSISNLNIANTNAETYGIFLNGANNCTIKNCNIVNTGKSSYCICLANGANFNNVTDNYLKAYGITYGHGSFTRSTPPLLLSGSHNNYIANNHVEADDANGIYLSSYSGGPLKGGVSNYNIIFNNTVHYNVLPTSWAYGIQVMGKSNVIKQNTIIGGYRGISTAEGSGNVITENLIINLTGADFNHPGVESGGEYGIVASYSSIVTNNTIIGAKVISTGAGISAIDNSIVEDNWVNITLKGRGIVAAGSNVIIRSNVVYTELGSGIYEKDDGSGLLIDGNIITSSSGVGILVEQLSSVSMPKNVTVINNVISTKNKYAIDVSGVQMGTSEEESISNNTIIGKGLINSPSGVIDTSKPTYNYKGTIHYITPDNIRDYINSNGGLTSEVSDKDILSFSGSFSNEVIYITKSVKITGDNPIFYNSTFKVTSGNVFIENLTIINKFAERVNAWGIFVNHASGVRIMNNNITVNDLKAAYAIYVLESSDVDVWNNHLSSQGDYLTFTLLSYASERCNFVNNTIYTIGTGNAYKFSPEKCIDGNELVINGRSYCLDGQELVIDGNTYCLDGNELSINGVSYCLDGNELVIDGNTYCLDGNEFVIDGTSYCLDGNELSINGTSYVLNKEVIIVNGTSYCLDGEEVVIDGTSYCLDGNELSINGVSYCLDGNELVINGTTYCLDGSESGSSGLHIVSEIYQTYGILLLYSSNNLISGNDVNVTSNLQDTYSSIGNESSQNSLVGIDLYFNCHNNTVSNNNVFVSGNDNFIYGVGVLGYYTGHSAPKGQGATNNSFNANKITLEGVYCAEGIIIGDESEDTFIEDNIIDVKSNAIVYGVYFEMSHKSTVENNNLTLNAQAVYGIQGYGSNYNVVSSNIVNANAKDAYGVLFLNGNFNKVTDNKINANNTDEKMTVHSSDSIKSGDAGIYLCSNSTNNYVENNEITSNIGYAVLIDDEASENTVINNYLVSENGIGNKAVSDSVKNVIADNYKYVATAIANDIAVPYLGVCNLTLRFDKDLDGAVVKFYDVDNFYIGQSTVAGGIASIEYSFDESYIPSEYVFYAKLSKEGYKASTYNIGIDISKGNILIDVPVVSIQQGSSGDIVATVLDELGNPIKGATVQFNRLNSAGRATPIGTAKTGADGVAKINYAVPLSLADGSHEITAIVKDVDNYNDASVSSILKVTKKPLITGGKDYSVYYGNKVTYKVRAVDINGKPVAGKYVTFKINGKTKSVKTDKNGYASYSVSLKAGTYTIQASFNDYTTSNKITFKPTLVAKDVSVKKAKTVKFTVKVVNKNGKVLKNKKVTFKLSGKKYTATTNKNGVATLSLKNLKVGKYTITSTYDGCTVKNTITIKK